jgi:hypothetical protein
MGLAGGGERGQHATMKRCSSGEALLPAPSVTGQSNPLWWVQLSTAAWAAIQDTDLASGARFSSDPEGTLTDDAIRTARAQVRRVRG